MCPNSSQLPVTLICSCPSGSNANSFSCFLDVPPEIGGELCYVSLKAIYIGLGTTQGMSPRSLEVKMSGFLQPLSYDTRTTQKSTTLAIIPFSTTQQGTVSPSIITTFPLSSQFVQFEVYDLATGALVLTDAGGNPTQATLVLEAVPIFDLGGAE